jgi:mono/diheme cytochrome c family protein
VPPRNRIASRAARRAAVVALSLVALAIGGCGTSETGSFDRGQQLFAAKCATCHALRAAGSTAQIGPDLDAAFAQARASGMDPDTFAGVIRAQVEYPRPGNASGRSNPSVTMPADLVTGQELDDVAHYVATVAGNPAFKGPQLPNDPGAPVFAQNQCSSCHTLEAAGAMGTVGPDLDKVIPRLSPSEVKKQIVDPNSKITPGFPPNVMPDNFDQLISPPDLNKLVQFLIKYSGNPSGKSTSGGSTSSGSSSSK